MPIAPWLRALNAVGTVAEATRAFRGMRDSSKTGDAPAAPDASDLERGLANVVVAALKEAFDRDRARFELERDEREAVRAEAERALRADRLRQAGLQAIGQVRLLTGLSLTCWVVSVAAAGLLAPVPPTGKWLLGAGWLALSAALATAFIAHQRLTAWLAVGPPPQSADLSATSPGLPDVGAHAALPWLVLAGFVLTAVSILAGV
jgi:hypothetical protein